jgi:hypothetical protein
MQSSADGSNAAPVAFLRRCILLSMLVAAVVSQAQADDARRLPSWVKFSGEIRGRAEVYAGSEKVQEKTEWYYLNRIRFNTTFSPGSNLQFFVQLQDSRAARTEGIAAPPNLVDTADVRQAYVHVGAAEGRGWFLRVGRQPLSFGGARLLWMSEWGNVGPGFDAARISYANESYSINLFAATAVRAVVDEMDRPRTDRQVYGFFGTFQKIVPRTTIEPFSIWKHNKAALCEHGRPGHLDIVTNGFRAAGKPHQRIDWIADFAIQSGHVASDDAFAWAGHWEAGVRPWALSGPRLVAEYQRASGDAANGDGTHGSFDQLYPAWKFGTADPIGWSNMQEGTGGVEWSLGRGWTARAAYHHFWLLSLSDSLYAANGAVLGRNPQASSKRIGGELDLRVTHRFGERLDLMVGFGRFLAGPYWRETKGTSGITYPFVMWTYTF